ncbi:MAG: hypothetical protein E7331_03895 [Clostridiales bacterium]|nr:hypothetical protein [Clostridiales bacterium]
MRLGMAGAVICTLAGTAVGGMLRERKYARLRLLEGEAEILARMRLMLMEERLSMPRLLEECARAAPDNLFAKRLLRVGQLLEKQPLLSLENAYGEACRLYPLTAEKKEDRYVMHHFFRQLGRGTAAMREQAAASALRKVKPALESAEEAAKTGGKLSMQLGLLLGLVVGIALW